MSEWPNSSAQGFLVEFVGWVWVSEKERDCCSTNLFAKVNIQKFSCCPSSIQRSAERYGLMLLFFFQFLGKVKAPIVIGRDHLDCGSVASPYRETGALKTRV